jgi:SAM-dependent methyltransferase
MRKASAGPDFEAYARTHRMEGLDIPPSRRFVLDAHITADMRVLDFGCGDGQHLEYLSRRVPKENLVGAEISRMRVDRVRAKGFACVAVDGVDLPFENGSFDAAVLFEVVEHVPARDAARLFRELARVMRPDGVLVGSTPNYPVKRFYDLRQRLTARVKSRRLSGLGRLWADDPTHVFPCRFKTIERFGRRSFGEVELFTTFGGQARFVGARSPARLLSPKIVFAFGKPLR